MVELNIKKLRSGGLITNYFCTSSCKHCLYNCSPRWEKRYIDPVTVESSLKKVIELGCRSVHIGGGEPLLRPEKLAAVLEIAEALGVSVEYVETNSSWFKDPDSATALLSRLREKGLHTLLVSISPFHNESIPFSRVSGVIAAARYARVGVFPWVNDFMPDLSQFDPAKTHTLQEYTDTFGSDYLMQILQRYWIHLGGRALDTFRPLLAQKTFQQIIRESDGDCRSELSNTSHFHTDLFGNYIPGLCSGLSISIEDLGKPLAAENYPVLTSLYRSGIRGLIKLAEDIAGFSPQKNLYINKCDLCTEVRSFLVQDDYLGSNELSPIEFYSSQLND